MEQIYTIPVNEAFDTAIEAGGCSCPLCILFNKLEENELDLILGASMMEPDIRIKTNEQGFCGQHYDRMFRMKNRLGLALMMESHLEQLEKELRPSVLGNLVGQKGAKTDRRLKKLESSCYLCGRIESQFSRMIATCVYLYGTDSAFRKKLVASPMLCLPHAKRLLEEGSAKLQKKYYSDFFDGVYTVAENYMKGLRSDVSAFCRSFDYRYQEENVGSAKDSVERTIRYLTSVER